MQHSFSTKSLVSPESVLKECLQELVKEGSLSDLNAYLLGCGGWEFWVETLMRKRLFEDMEGRRRKAIEMFAAVAEVSSDMDEKIRIRLKWFRQVLGNSDSFKPLKLTDAQATEVSYDDDYVAGKRRRLAQPQVDDIIQSLFGAKWDLLDAKGKTLYQKNGAPVSERLRLYLDARRGGSSVDPEATGSGVGVLDLVTAEVVYDLDALVSAALTKKDSADRHGLTNADMHDWIVWDARMQRFDYRRGIRNQKLVKKYDRDRTGAFKDRLRNAFSLLHFEEDDAFRYTPHFRPKRFSLKNCMLSQYLYVIDELIFHVCGNYARSGVYYAELSHNVADLIFRPWIFRHLMLHSQPVETHPQEHFNYLAAFDRGHCDLPLKAEMKRLASLRALPKDGVSCEGDRQFTVTQEEDIVQVGINYLYRASDREMEELVFGKGMDRLYKPYFAILDRCDMAYNRMLRKKMIESSMLPVLQRRRSASGRELEIPKRAPSKTLEPTPRLMPAMSFYGAPTPSAAKSSLVDRVVGLDLQGDQHGFPYCPFIHERFIDFCKEKAKLRGRVFGMRPHLGMADNVSYQNYYTVALKRGLFKHKFGGGIEDPSQLLWPVNEGTEEEELEDCLDLVDQLSHDEEVVQTNTVVVDIENDISSSSRNNSENDDNSDLDSDLRTVGETPVGVVNEMLPSGSGGRPTRSTSVASQSFGSVMADRHMEISKRIIIKLIERVSSKWTAVNAAHEGPSCAPVPVRISNEMALALLDDSATKPKFVEFVSSSFYNTVIEANFTRSLLFPGEMVSHHPLIRLFKHDEIMKMIGFKVHLVLCTGHDGVLPVTPCTCPELHTSVGAEICRAIEHGVFQKSRDFAVVRSMSSVQGFTEEITQGSSVQKKSSRMDKMILWLFILSVFMSMMLFGAVAIIKD